MARFLSQPYCKSGRTQNSLTRAAAGLTTDDAGDGITADFHFICENAGRMKNDSRTLWEQARGDDTTDADARAPPGRRPRGARTLHTSTILRPSPRAS